MRYWLDQPLMSLDGKTSMKDGQGADLTFKLVSGFSLSQATDKDPTEKYQSFALAVKMASEKSDSIDLNAEEVARLKRVIGELMPPLVVGRMFDILDQKDHAT